MKHEREEGKQMTIKGDINMVSFILREDVKEKLKWWIMQKVCKDFCQRGNRCALIQSEEGKQMTIKREINMV